MPNVPIRLGRMAKKRRPVVALIEDDPLVRNALAAALDHADNGVVAAASGAEGLAVLESEGVDVAIVDIVMPGRMDGVALVREAKRSNPGLRVVFTSGPPPPENEDIASLGVFLPKPSRTEEIIPAIVRELRDDRQDEPAITVPGAGAAPADETEAH